MTRSEGLESPLKSAVLDLGLPGDEALMRKPAGSRRPDGLALEFDDAYTAFVASLESLPTEPQLESLQALDSALAAMSGTENAELWTEAAVKNHPRWAEVRRLAREAAARFGWRAE